MDGHRDGPPFHQAVGELSACGVQEQATLTMLTLASLPKSDVLRATVSPALADYRNWRDDEMPPGVVPTIRNAFPRWFVPRSVDLREQALNEALVHDDHWHLQIHVADRPRYYTRVRLIEADWVVEWFGEAWLAEAVHDGLSVIERHAPDLHGELRLVSSSLYEFTSFWLPAHGQHLVVSASSQLEPRLPPLMTFIETAQLSQALSSAFGPRRASGGSSGRHKPPPRDKI
jgi:hypothetical protein